MQDKPERTLEPTEKPETWVMLEMESETHVYPNFGPKHTTVNCWCQPTIGFDELNNVPMISHRELH